MDRDSPTCRRELDTVWQEVQADLTEASLIVKQPCEVVLVNWFLEDWPDQVHFASSLLGLKSVHTLLDEFDAIKVLVYKGESVVGELCFVHQVFHQTHHHHCLILHLLEMLSHCLDFVE